MNVLHISPTYFHQDSVVGGGERYVYELCKEMQKGGHQVTLLSFGKENKFFVQDGVEYNIVKPLKNIRGNILNPLSLPSFSLIRNADVIHCHQYFNLLTEMYLVLGYLFNIPVFVTDHGGGGATFLHRLGVKYLVKQFLCVSHHSKKSLRLENGLGSVIYGGADINHFKKSETKKIKNKYISTGRILPHKGHHHIIKCLRDDEKLVIVGRYNDDDEYYRYLQQISENKNIEFKQNLKDEELYEEIVTSELAIFPSTNINVDGNIIPGEPELFGLAPVEIMATGTPVIVSNIGSYPEVALSENFVFSHGNTQALRDKIDEVKKNNLSSEQFCNHVHQHFTWNIVSQKCLEVYKKFL
jgi:glycosyltransferase involved in cell wall biosynthesis